MAAVRGRYRDVLPFNAQTIVAQALDDDANDIGPRGVGVISDRFPNLQWLLVAFHTHPSLRAIASALSGRMNIGIPRNMTGPGSQIGLRHGSSRG